MSQAQTITATVADIVASNDEPKVVVQPTKTRTTGDFLFIDYDDGSTVIHRHGVRIARVYRLRYAAKHFRKHFAVEVTYNNGQSSYGAAHKTRAGAELDAIHMACYYNTLDICR